MLNEITLTAKKYSATMQTIDEFKAFFESDLVPLLRPLEEFRVKRVKIFNRLKYLAFFFGLLFLGSFFTVNDLLITFSGMLFILMAGLAYESLSKTNIILRKAYKSRILPQILKFISLEFEYFPNQKISKSIFDTSLLFPQEIKLIKGEDFMRFKIDRTGIMFCEAEVYGYGPSSKIFGGVFICATFNKSFASKTFVFPEKSTSFFRKLKFNVMGASFLVKLEDPEFEKEFIILGEDQVESRYILTPGLMQRILEYKKKLKIDIAFSFISQRLYCTIPNSKNLFEPALFESFLDFHFVLKSYEPIILYTDIVKDLNLNLKIWSKQ